MKYWSLVLHFYQPATQELQITEAICRTCYLPLLRMLKGKNNVGLSINISGSLLLQLQRLGMNEFFELVGDLVREGKVELLMSPIHHPLIPITPQRIVERQLIRSRELILKTTWVEPIRGVFMPELGVDENSLGYIASQAEFMLADETAVGGFGLYDRKGKTLVAGSRKMCELLRSAPKRLETEKVVKYAGSLVGGDGLMISVHDAELFGHHYEERLELLTGLLDWGEIRFIKVSEATSLCKKSSFKAKNVSSSTWQNTKTFAMWDGNELQKKYLNLAEMAYGAFEEVTEELGDQVREVAIDHLDQGWSSCHLYWLSNTPWWHPDLVERGATNLVRCVRTLPVSFETKVRAETLYHDFLKDMWLYHWSGEVEKGYKKHEKERVDVLSEMDAIMG